MNSDGAMMGPRPANISLQAVRGAEVLAAYIGVCPTCLGWDDPEATHDERDATPGRPVCPTCGECSPEWDLTQAIETQLTAINKLDALDAAVRADGVAPE